MKKIVMGYWDCKYCGTKDIPGDKMNCPGCNKGRGKEVVFHLSPNDRKNQMKRYVDEGTEEYRRATSGPDWICPYCDSNNEADRKICRGCGHPRDKGDADYFQLNPDRGERIIVHSTAGSTDTVERNGYERNNPPQNNADLKEQHPTRNIPWRNILISILAVLLVVGIVYLFSPKERYITITSFDWERNITVEEYRTIRESDWSVPTGGRVVYTQEEIHHYDHVLDHYETVMKSRTVITGSHYETVTRWRQVVIGSHEEVTGYRDLGNGYFEEVTRTVTDYGTESYEEPVLVYDYGTEYYPDEEPVYVDVPVYRTKYYYDIERWVYDHTATSAAHNHEPYWPVLELEENQRENGRDETYGITAVYQDKESHYELDYEHWSKINIGDGLHVKVYFGGNIEIIEDE